MDLGARHKHALRTHAPTDPDAFVDFDTEPAPEQELTRLRRPRSTKRRSSGSRTPRRSGKKSSRRSGKKSSRRSKKSRSSSSSSRGSGSRYQRRLRAEGRTPGPRSNRRYPFAKPRVFMSQDNLRETYFGGPEKYQDYLNDALSHKGPTPVNPCPHGENHFWVRCKAPTKRVRRAA